MRVRAITAITIAGGMLATAGPAAAQERGTIEIGAFGNAAAYDDAIGADNGWGGGGRVGAFLFPRLSVEFDVGRRSAPRADGLQTLEVEAFAARLTAVPLIMGPLSILAGAGFIHTDYQLEATDGFQALLGARLAILPSVAIRVDGLADFNGNETRNRSVQVGLSYYRQPAFLTRTVTTPAPPAAPVTVAQRPDSVSAAETARLRALEADHRALLDSLAWNESISQVVYFDHDVSEVDAAARGILDGKATLLASRPASRIVVTGYASMPGTAAYNMALGQRRAEAARDYLVSRGVNRARIDVVSYGSGGLAVVGAGEQAHAANRRAEFRQVGN